MGKMFDEELWAVLKLTKYILVALAALILLACILPLAIEVLKWIL